MRAPSRRGQAVSTDLSDARALRHCSLASSRRWIRAGRRVSPDDGAIYPRRRGSAKGSRTASVICLETSLFTLDLLLNWELDGAGSRGARRSPTNSMGRCGYPTLFSQIALRWTPTNVGSRQSRKELARRSDQQDFIPLQQRHPGYSATGCILPQDWAFSAGRGPVPDPALTSRLEPAH